MSLIIFALVIAGFILALPTLLLLMSAVIIVPLGVLGKLLKHKEVAL